MTLAVLSFETRKCPARVRFRCDDILIDEGRDLEPNPPFVDWIGTYATGHWTRETLLAIGRWLDTPEYWLTRFAAAPVPGTLVIEASKNPVSASNDRTLKVWDLQAGACLLTHRANAPYLPIATTATAIIAGAAAGAVGFLDYPSPDACQGSAQR